MQRILSTILTGIFVLAALPAAAQTPKPKASHPHAAAHAAKTYIKNHPKEVRHAVRTYVQRHPAAVRRYVQSHPAVVRHAVRTYAQNHPKEVRHAARTYVQNHPKQVRRAVRTYVQRHPAVVRRDVRRYVANHPKLVRTQVRTYISRHPAVVRRDAHRFVSWYLQHHPRYIRADVSRYIANHPRLLRNAIVRDLAMHRANATVVAGRIVRVNGRYIIVQPPTGAPITVANYYPGQYALNPGAYATIPVYYNNGGYQYYNQAPVQTYSSLPLLYAALAPVVQYLTGINLPDASSFYGYAGYPSNYGNMYGYGTPYGYNNYGSNPYGYNNGYYPAPAAYYNGGYAPQQLQGVVIAQNGNSLMLAGPNGQPVLVDITQALQQGTANTAMLHMGAPVDAIGYFNGNSSFVATAIQ